MSVDIKSNRLYWVNQNSATIQYMDLDTERVTTVMYTHFVSMLRSLRKGQCLLYI